MLSLHTFIYKQSVHPSGRMGSVIVVVGSKYTDIF